VAPEPFDIIEPNDETPVLVEVPHAGLWLDAEAAGWTTAPARCIARDADLYVDELFANSADAGATLLCARLSRYVVDLNRASDDFDRGAVVGGPHLGRPRGVIWRLTSDGLPVLRDPISVSEYERRVRLFHAPYHGALQSLLDRKRDRFGFAVMLCAHSMPTPRPRGGINVHTADLVPGTQGRTAADGRYIDLIDRVGVEHGWCVEHDVPYRGGYSTRHYGRPDENVHVVQLEIARRLYMDETTLGRHPEGFAQVMEFAKDVVEQLVQEAERAIKR
jgi:N-formylglutamate deformylase